MATTSRPSDVVRTGDAHSTYVFSAEVAPDENNSEISTQEAQSLVAAVTRQHEAGLRDAVDKAFASFVEALPTCLVSQGVHHLRCTWAQSEYYKVLQAYLRQASVDAPQPVGRSTRSGLERGPAPAPAHKKRSEQEHHGEMFMSPRKQARTEVPAEDEGPPVLRTVADLHSKTWNASDLHALECVLLDAPEEPRWVNAATGRGTT